MRIVTEDITFGGTQLTLTNQRAMFWASKGWLIISDTHIGKTAHFRKHGIAVPDDIMHKDIGRLETLMKYFSPKKIVVVGDLFHANYNSNISYFKDWLKKLSIEFILVKGNHDRFSIQFYLDLGLTSVVNELDIEGIRFIHEPDTDVNENHCISGHIHPGVALRLNGGKRIKLPCFMLNNKQLILPAFSQFTGFNSAFSEISDYYAFTEESIFKIEKSML